MAGHGRYKIVRKIADGGMAEIFLATQHGAEGFERPVVLKRILQALVADPQFRNMMIDEAHVAMSLNHSNIVQVLDLGQAKGRYFLALEFVDGWDLNQILNRLRALSGFSLPPELALYITAEVCRALSYAHAKTRDGKALGIVHRDISPHNVLISDQGEVKLTDFGIAKAMGRRERTGAGIIKGKLAFMSPEQASGSVLDARSDLFSVGTMLYLLTTGKKPFEAPTDLEAILRVRQCDFPPPEAVNPAIPPKLASLIVKAMRAAPSERYQSAEEMLIDIEAVQRSVFQPAGQTELKRWLAELQQRDGIPPIGRASPQATETEQDVVDLVEGADVILEESGAENTEPPLPAVPPRAPPTPPPVPTPATAEPRPSRRGWSALLLTIIAGSAVWLYIKRRPAPAPAGTRTADEPDPVLAQAPPAAPDPEPAPQPQAVAPEPQPDATAPPAIEPPPLEGAADAPPDAGAHEEEDEEESLLRRTEPGATEAVIGPEESVAEPPPPTPTKKTAITPSRPTPEQVSVKIVTRPEGAVIRLNKRVFGRAPMSLRFAPGRTYELSFVKRGYVTGTKRFVVTGRKNQTVNITLRKQPTQKKSFFKRLFGG